MVKQLCHQTGTPSAPLVLNVCHLVSC